MWLEKLKACWETSIAFSGVDDKATSSHKPTSWWEVGFCGSIVHNANQNWIECEHNDSEFSRSEKIGSNACAMCEEVKMIMWPDNDCVSFGGWCQTPPIPTVGPGSHSCGNKKGRREKFPKRKEEKREKRIPLDLLCSTVWHFLMMKKFKNPQKIGALK